MDCGDCDAVVDCCFVVWLLDYSEVIMMLQGIFSENDFDRSLDILESPQCRVLSFCFLEFQV